MKPVIHQLLDLREKRSMLKKLNMVIGTFFSEIGTELLRQLANLDPNSDQIKKDIISTESWSGKNFANLGKNLRNYNCEIAIEKTDLIKLRDFLMGKRDFLLVLLGNPNLLEHESFTELLWAVFHLTDELSHRENVDQISEKDQQHIAGDINRVYDLIMLEWLAYMKHLKDDYPYLFSLAMRINPFDREASPEVK